MNFRQVALERQRMNGMKKQSDHLPVPLRGGGGFDPIIQLYGKALLKSQYLSAFKNYYYYY